MFASFYQAIRHGFIDQYPHSISEVVGPDKNRLDHCNQRTPSSRRARANCTSFERTRELLHHITGRAAKSLWAQPFSCKYMDRGPLRTYKIRTEEVNSSSKRRKFIIITVRITKCASRCSSAF